MRGPAALATALCLTAVSVIVGAPRAADAIPPPQQFAANPGFESELQTPLLAPWLCEPGTASVMPSVDESPILVGTPTPTSTAMCAQDVPVQPNGTYDLYADVRGGDVAIGSEFGTAWAAPSQQWTRLGIRFTVGPEASLVRIFLHGRSGGAPFAADNVFFTGPESRMRAPATPTDLTAIQRTSHSVRLMWTESPGATVYRVFRDGVLIQPYTFFSTLVVDGLAPGSSHVYTVLALNTAGESARSTPLTARTKPAHRYRPPAPRAVTATLQPPAIGVFLNWPAVGTATDGYNVYRNGARIAWVYGPGFRDAIIPIGATYSYEITALNSAGESRKSAPVVVVH